MRSERGALAVFVSWPEPGRVLPRLKRRIGADAAAQLGEAFLDDLVPRLCGPSLGGVLYAEDGEDAFRQRFPGTTVRAQRGRGAGRRLRACMEELLAANPTVVVVRGGMPDLHPRMVQAAFEMLERRDAVVGPNGRGGVALLGMREPRDVFRGVRWDEGGALAAILSNLERAHLDHGFFPTLEEVETLEDLPALRRRLHPASAPHTCAALDALGLAPEVRDVG